MGLSPNFGPRRDGATPDIIVLHYTAMPDWRKARDWLCNPEAEVSAHYLISPQGELVSLVDEDQRAWHAGAGSWGNVADVNSRSIGIELSNDGFSPFSAPLMDAVETLLSKIMERWAIRPERVIAHSDLAPGRKIDPGARFDWARLVRAGLAVKASPNAPTTVSEDAFRTDLSAIGYGDVPELDVLISALRMRHRQGHVGPLDGWDCAIAADLAARFPIAKFNLTS
ncbi:N-acetylmuramoyl-L-alanine amidase [Octadecabacter sp. B2R22]|nr:N-acetylmuramoyl-L-alanine amidase [Octadecabacter sp. B2R22]